MLDRIWWRYLLDFLLSVVFSYVRAWLFFDNIFGARCCTFFKLQVIVVEVQVDLLALCSCSSMASSSRFASNSDPHLPTTSEQQKRKRRGTASTKSHHPQENGNSRKGFRESRSFDWPFPRRERPSHSPHHKTRRHSIDRFFESSKCCFSSVLWRYTDLGTRGRTREPASLSASQCTCSWFGES